MIQLRTKWTRAGFQRCSSCRAATHSCRYTAQAPSAACTMTQQAQAASHPSTCSVCMQEHVQSAQFVCFNLGFLPGGERSVVTRPDTTVAALQAALSILTPRGLVSVLCYVGHEGEE